MSGESNKEDRLQGITPLVAGRFHGDLTRVALGMCGECLAGATVYPYVCVCVRVMQIVSLVKASDDECETSASLSFSFSSAPQSGSYLDSSLFLFGSVLVPWNRVGTVRGSCLQTILRLANLHLKNLSQVTKFLVIFSFSKISRTFSLSAKSLYTSFPRSLYPYAT